MTTVPPGFEVESVFEEGRGLPYTQLGDWVNHAGISDRAARVYWLLCEHLNVKRGDREVWPTQAVLAKVLGIKRAADIAPATDELVVIGAIEIRPEYDNVGRKVRNRYVIHRSPASDYVGPRSLSEFYALLQAESGQRYEAWFTARRKEISDGVARLQRERKDADARAKAEATRRALGGAEVRTSPSPATFQESPGRPDVRNSSRGRAGFRTTGVRDPAPKQDEVQQDESLSSRLPRQTRQKPSASPEERETPAAPQNYNTGRQIDNHIDKTLTAAQRAIRATTDITPAEEAAFIDWITQRHTPRGPGWWRTAAPDLPEHAATWRAQQAPPAAPKLRVVHQPCACCGQQRPSATAQGRHVYCSACTSTCTTCNNLAPTDQLHHGQCLTCLPIAERTAA